jgi:hypothetical protein
MSDRSVVIDMFDLRLLIREVASLSKSPDPVVVAHEVLRQIGDEDRDEALWQALRVMTRHVIAESRFTRRPGDQTTEVKPSIHSRQGISPSRKVAQIRDHWKSYIQQYLQERINISPYEWKFLGDCTANDLYYAADFRDNLAVANAVKAQWYRDRAKMVEHAGVDCVSKLPEKLLKEFSEWTDE